MLLFATASCLFVQVNEVVLICHVQNFFLNLLRRRELDNIKPAQEVCIIVWRRIIIKKKKNSSKSPNSPDKIVFFISLSLCSFSTLIIMKMKVTLL